MNFPPCSRIGTRAIGLRTRAAAGLLAALLGAAPPALAAKPSETIPWTGDLGVTEDTASIMRRQQAQVDSGVADSGEEGGKHRPLGRKDPQNLFQNPGSPDAVSYPGAGPALPAGQTTDLNFTGATLSDTRSFPPDSMGAAGPSQYIVAVNGRVRSFDKATGAADGVLDADTDVFFNSVMTPPATNNFTTDPRIRYDRLSGRWFIIMIDVPGRAGSLPNRVMIAVSGAPVVSAATPWTFFQFRQDQVAPTAKTDNGKFADYPTLGIDANALYIGVNIFATRGQGSFANTTAFVVRKSSLLGSGPLVATAFRGLISNGPQGGPYTPQGVDNYDPAATEGYVIGVDAAYYGRLQLLRISDPGGTPSLSSQVLITVPVTGGTINVPHLGNTGDTAGYLDGLDYRLMAAHVRNGRLWTCANIAVDNTGSPAGTDTRMGVRWYELTGIATGQTPSVVQSGTLFQPSAANDTSQRHYWMGTVMVSGQGHAALGFSAAGASEYVNAGYAGRLADDALGTLRTPVLYTASSSAYNPPGDPGGPGGRRWGDYSYTCLDPSDDMTFWTIQEWCEATDSYAVQVLKILAPPPATPITATPATLAPGNSNVNVVIIGASVDGSGFFDPGPGFSNHIAAAISGLGVTVESAVFQTPTNITLSLSVSASAPAGARVVIITNPDGQSVASAGGLLTIGGPAPTNQPPVLAAIANQVIHAGVNLILTNVATDPDLPPNTLTFSLGPGAPAAAAVDASSGIFSWPTSDADAGTTNSISITVQDTGVPPLSDTKTFSVTVLARPSIQTIIAAGNSVQLTWQSVAGVRYRLQSKTNLTDSLWLDAPAAVTATGPLTTGSDASPTGAQRYYRVRVE